jgi:hypothetical protein
MVLLTGVWPVKSVLGQCLYCKKERSDTQQATYQATAAVDVLLDNISVTWGSHCGE